MDKTTGEEKMSKYQLHCKEGCYSADSIIKLLIEVFRHRLWHLIKEKKWRD